MLEENVSTSLPTPSTSFLGLKRPKIPELEVTDNQVCKKITANQIKVWPKKIKIFSGKLSVKYVILNRIAATNWFPTTHSSYIGTWLGKFIYVVGSKAKMDFDAYICEQTRESPMTLHYKLFGENHVPDIVGTFENAPAVGPMFSGGRLLEIMLKQLICLIFVSALEVFPASCPWSVILMVFYLLVLPVLSVVAFILQLIQEHVYMCDLDRSASLVLYRNPSLSLVSVEIDFSLAYMVVGTSYSAGTPVCGKLSSLVVA
ncbi:transmembrane protein, putative [Medicago truncatula]|uniref:Transmembrane protein, putative n=1 Tax=Medicago truncatula TaxID=3880 RepID=A0A072UHL7_MEDTR|nr:transmembrane protein, putative [Medicago truncatula]